MYRCTFSLNLKITQIVSDSKSANSNHTVEPYLDLDI